MSSFDKFREGIRPFLSVLRIYFGATLALAVVATIMSTIGRLMSEGLMKTLPNYYAHIGGSIAFCATLSLVCSQGAQVRSLSGEIRKNLGLCSLQFFQASLLFGVMLGVIFAINNFLINTPWGDLRDNWLLGRTMLFAILASFYLGLIHLCIAIYRSLFGALWVSKSLGNKGLVNGA